MNIDYSVAQALTRHSVGNVATAIEHFSCYHGRDRFGRLKLLEGHEKEKILKLLEEYYLHEKFWYIQEDLKDEQTGEVPSDIFDCNFELPHWHFGWPESKIPDLLKKIEIHKNYLEKFLIISQESSEANDKNINDVSDFSGISPLVNYESREEIYTKGKYTHLAVIGALIKQCELDINAPKIANKIAFIVNQKIGWPIHEKTITSILKQIPDAIERKGK